MAQDLRDLLKAEKEEGYRMKSGHEERFADRLDRAMQVKKKHPYSAYLIAATLLVLVGLGVFFYMNLQSSLPLESNIANQPMGTEAMPQLSLGDLSPDLKKIEQYYVTSINLQLSDLEISSDNKAMVDDFMDRLAELNREYQALNKELNTIGPNDQTINALVNNLQLRLELLYRLKDKLQTLKSSENGTEPSQSI